MKVNGTREVIVSPFIRKDDTYYVSPNDLANYLDYSYSWDIQENQGVGDGHVGQCDNHTDPL